LSWGVGLGNGSHTCRGPGATQVLGLKGARRPSASALPPRGARRGQVKRLKRSG
jgi:hypothetical protein